MESPTTLTRISHDDPALRGITIVALLTIAAVHLLDAPSKFDETPWIGIGYIAIIAGGVLVSALLLHGSNRLTWVLAGIVAATPLAGYLLTRSIGLPGDTGDIGNWGEQLGLASLFTEALVVIVSTYGIGLASRAARTRVRQPTHETA